MAQYSRKLAKGIRWYFKFDYQGKTHFSKACYLTKQEAKKAEAIEYKLVTELKPTTSNDILVKLAVQERISYLKVKSSTKYYIDSKRYLDKFLGRFDNKNLSGISKKDISDFIMSLADEFYVKGKKNFSVNAAIRCYKALYNYVIDQHELDIKNPFIKMKLFSIEKRIKYIPPDDEINSLLEICDVGQKMLVEFVRDTGARIGEALRFTYPDIFDDYIVLYTHKSRNSNLIPRKVPKPDCIKNVNSKAKSNFVFCRWSNTPDFLDEKVVKLGFRRWSWHNLRHRYASMLSKSGKPIFEIMSLLGHSNLSTTQNYLQLL